METLGAIGSHMEPVRAIGRHGEPKLTKRSYRKPQGAIGSNRELWEP